MITKADKVILIRQGDLTLAKWYCLIKAWAWPEDLPNPAPSPGYARARQIMQWIYEMVGGRLISRIWNEDMTDQEFEDFWMATVENDPAAKVRRMAHLKQISRIRAENDARASSAYQEWAQRHPQAAAAVQLVHGRCRRDPGPPSIKIISDVEVACSSCGHLFWGKFPFGAAPKKSFCPCCTHTRRVPKNR